MDKNVENWKKRKRKSGYNAQYNVEHYFIYKTNFYSLNNDLQENESNMERTLKEQLMWGLTKLFMIE